MTGPETYGERLSVPVRWWILGITFLATVWIAIVVAVSAFTATVATGVGLVAMAAGFWAYGGARVSVANGFLTAGSARVPLSCLGEATALDATETQRMLGRGADARAFLVTRPYLSRAVWVQVTDPADPTPYLLVGSRHPQRLASVLAAAVVGTTPTADGRSPDTMAER